MRVMGDWETKEGDEALPQTGHVLRANMGKSFRPKADVPT